MSRFSNEFDPEQGVTNPEWFYIIGKRRGLSEAADNKADELLHTCYGEIPLAILLEVIPDGVIIQRGGECYQTRGSRLAAFDPQSGGWTDQAKCTPYPDMTALDWTLFLKHEIRNHLAFTLRYNYGNRHEL